MKETNCPYCGEGINLNHDGGQGFSEDEIHSDFCENCGKNFIYTTSISFNFYPDKAECLNEGEHDFNPTITVPRYATRMVCSVCDKERGLTEEERGKYNIPTYEQYLMDIEND